MGMRKTIVWDVDDVLNDLMGEWFRGWRHDHPECTVAYEDLKNNPPHGILGISMDSYLQSLDNFRLSPHYGNLAPVREVKDWFLQHGDSFRHIALTAVPLRAASSSGQWVLRNFGTWIRTFHFVPSKRKGETIPNYENDKTEALKVLGPVHFFIDDHPDHVVAAQKAGIPALFFPRPWNHSGMSISVTLSRMMTC